MTGWLLLITYTGSRAAHCCASKPLSDRGIGQNQNGCALLLPDLLLCSVRITELDETNENKSQSLQDDVLSSAGRYSYSAKIMGTTDLFYARPEFCLGAKRSELQLEPLTRAVPVQ